MGYFFKKFFNSHEINRSHNSIHYSVVIGKVVVSDLTHPPIPLCLNFKSGQIIVLPFISSASCFNNFEECLYYSVSVFVFTGLRHKQYFVLTMSMVSCILFIIFWKCISVLKLRLLLKFEIWKIILKFSKMNRQCIIEGESERATCVYTVCILDL